MAVQEKKDAVTCARNQFGAGGRVASGEVGVRDCFEFENWVRT